MRRTRTAALLVGSWALIAIAAHGQVPNTLPHNAKLFVAAMPDGFDEYVKAAIQKKQVPVTLVDDRSKAEYEMTGHSETEKAGTAKKVILLNWHSNEQASVQITDLASGEVVFAYSVNKKSSARGKRSTAEACAKHLKKAIRKAPAPVS